MGLTLLPRLEQFTLVGLVTAVFSSCASSLGESWMTVRTRGLAEWVKVGIFRLNMPRCETENSSQLPRGLYELGEGTCLTAIGPFPTVVEKDSYRYR